MRGDAPEVPVPVEEPETTIEVYPSGMTAAATSEAQPPIECPDSTI